MKKKILVSERQMKLLNRKKIVLVNESQLEKIINHINGGEKEILEEGWKGMVLAGFLTLANALNVEAQSLDAGDDNIQKKATEYIIKKNPNLESKRKTIENDLKANEVKYQDMLKKPAKKTRGTVQTTSDPRKVLQLIERGFTIQDIQTVMDTIPADSNALVIQSQMAHEFNSDEAFETGQYILTDIAKKEIIEIVGDLKGSKINSITIEASTDTESIQMTNETLAKKRAGAVRALLVENGIDAEVIGKDVLKANNKQEDEPDVYSGPLSAEERSKARVKTAKYRYVKLDIDATKEICMIEGTTAPQVIEKQFYEFKRITKKQKTKTRITTTRSNPKGSWTKGVHCGGK